MTDQQAKEIWQGILKILDEKMQFGLLEQVRSVVDVQITGAELKLSVSNDEALNFFRAEINQQRLIIVSRPLISLDRVIVQRVEAEPLR